MNRVFAKQSHRLAWFLSALLPSLFLANGASAQSFRVQCPTETALHPATIVAGQKVPDPAIKCQHIAGGDGFATMGDGNQIYLFGFGPLSGLDDLTHGGPGTQSTATFNDVNSANKARTEPADIMNNGVLYANAPAPMMAIDEDDEFFLTLSNVGQIMRPDLFEQHTVHFHGYPNASSFFDGVPDASVAINIAGSFTYYYPAPDAGTYFWHCHIAPPEHLQMGMVGQLFVRPRQNRVSPGASLYDALQPVGGAMYAYNDGDGTTRYDYDVPIQMMGFDPNFHFVGMTFNPEAFADMKDKYFLLNGRSYPDTINANVDNRGAAGIGGSVPNGPLATLGADGASRPSQPLHSLITLKSCSSAVSGDCTGKKTRALLRISDLSVTEHSTLATLGIPMTVIAQNARLLRDMAGNNLYYQTNSITLGGGESADVILDATDVAPGTYFLYSTNLDHLSNDAENFGGMMTEIVVN